MKHKLIEQRLKQIIIDLGNELDANFSTLTPDDIIYIFNENKLFIVDIESCEEPDNIIKIKNSNEAYTLSDFGQGFTLQNQDEETMTLTEKSLFDILDDFFQREF